MNHSTTRYHAYGGKKLNVVCQKPLANTIPINQVGTITNIKIVPKNPSLKLFIYTILIYIDLNTNIIAKTRL